MKLNKEDNLITIIIIGLLVVLAIAIFPADNDGATGADETLVVSGNFDKTVAPDLAKAYIQIETLKPTAAQSQAENADISKNVMDALVALVGKDNIETDQYYITKKYEWNEDLMKSEEVGYVTINTLKVTINDVDNVGSTLDASIQAGATGVNNINFELSQTTEAKVRNELLAQAAKEAKDKAQSLSDALGVTLDGIKSVSESSFNVNPYIYQSFNGLAKTDIASTQINPQNVEVTASVTLVYEID